jgi:hypothetical protein
LILIIITGEKFFRVQDLEFTSRLSNMPVIPTLKRLRQEDRVQGQPGLQ